MGRFLDHLQLGCKLIIILCGYFAVLGVSFLAGWGLGWAVARIF